MKHQMNCLSLRWAVICLMAPVLTSSAAVTVVADHLAAGADAPVFQFKRVDPPATNDAAARAVFRIVDGRRDPNGGDLDVLHDGRLPAGEDSPADNFFFQAGTDGGRLLIDLGSAVRIARINTYSRHAGARGPQVYRVYAADGAATGFNAEPRREIDPASCGWTRLADVDTRPASGDAGGQHGVRLSGDTNAPIGTFRYVLFDIDRTENRDPFGNTFFSEIDIVDADAPAPTAAKTGAAADAPEWIETADGKYKALLDTSQTPDLADWARREIAPIVREWYPKLVEMLPSEGFRAPEQFSIVFVRDMPGVADTSGTRIRCAAPWFRQNLKGEARGAFFHEMVHVVQQYGRSPRGSRAPGWLTEGITDYLRFYVFEPQTRGADIPARNVSRVRYDNSYRVTANFLNWLAGAHDRDLVRKLNAAIREGRYGEDLWKTLTGKTAVELNDEWKAALLKDDKK